MKVLSPLIVIAILSNFANAEILRASVPEIDCQGCVTSIKDRLKQEKEISSINVDLKTKVVTIVTAEGATLSDEQVRALVKDAGYDVSTLERE